tara:strand:+ start:1061 stop:1330 length:270 start_codon:yes stop_codon:yes gene_type:complete
MAKYTHLIDGVKVDYTAEEEAARDAEIQAWADAEPQRIIQRIKATRKDLYGNIGDQLDLLYKDMLADKGDKTGEWFKAVKKVKDDNPKG